MINKLIYLIGIIGLSIILANVLAFLFLLFISGLEFIGLFKLDESTGMLAVVVAINLIYYAWVPISGILLYRKRKVFLG